MINNEVIQTDKFGRCLRLSNDIVEILVSLDYGPRIASYSLHGKKNVFFEDVDRKVYFDAPEIKEYYGYADKWYNYGGHRLWSNPERFPQTFHPDTDAVDYTVEGNTAIIMQIPQYKNNIQLTMRITLSEDSSDVEVCHLIKNVDSESKKFAIWCISPMAPGGTVIVPMGELEDGALPNRMLVTWPYTDLSDSRLYVGKNYITLRQEPDNKNPDVNLGYNNPEALAAYSNAGTLFIKRFDRVENGHYSDMGVCFETYSCADFLEVESLGELKTVAPGEEVSHNEYWTLVAADDTFDSRNEEEIDKFFKQYVKGGMKSE